MGCCSLQIPLSRQKRNCAITVCLVVLNYKRFFGAHLKSRLDSKKQFKMCDFLSELIFNALDVLWLELKKKIKVFEFFVLNYHETQRKVISH